jgi:hypothetical protein
MGRVKARMGQRLEKRMVYRVAHTKSSYHREDLRVLCILRLGMAK